MILRIGFLILPLLLLVFPGCSKKNPIVPPIENDLLTINATRLYPGQKAIEAVRIVLTRLNDEKQPLTGRHLEVSADKGNMSIVTEKGNGVYEAIWTGSSCGEVVVHAKDIDSDPAVESRIVFLALDYLDVEWDVPMKVLSPVSTDGWEAAPFLYNNGLNLAFAYITLDMVALAAGFERPIGDERPGQVTPHNMNIFLARRASSSNRWWSDWLVDRPGCNDHLGFRTRLAAPTVSSDGLKAFCTVQKYTGTGYLPTKIYQTDPEFRLQPVLIDSVDIENLGEDNPYYSSSSGWLYFDTYDINDPLSKQDIWAARFQFGNTFDKPVVVSGGLNTENIETQPFVFEPEGVLYFASDRMSDEYKLSIWKVPISGDQIFGIPEKVASGLLALGKPSITLDGEWFCFAYAREETGGVNADIAIAKRRK